MSPTTEAGRADPAPRAVAGAVLTGGASRRMGRSKALIDVAGRPMGRRVADVLLAAGCDPVVLVGGDGEELAPLGLPVVPDEHPGCGPLGGVLTALRAAQGDVVVVACDLPSLTPEVVHAVLAAATAHPDADVAVARTDQLEPGCALWRPSAAAVVAAAFGAGERAVHRAIALVEHVEVRVPAHALRNVNEPADLPVVAPDDADR